MKKAKIMLSTIAIFALVGGALAFHAKKHALPLYLCDDNGNITATITVAAIPGGDQDLSATTTTVNFQCQVVNYQPE